MVGGEGLARGGEVEDLFGVDAATLKVVELLGQFEGLLVATSDVVDDPGLPDP